AIQEALDETLPDFLFVSPQSNPVALTLQTASGRTRFIMASYDVEAVRMQRLARSLSGVAKLAASLEARRARRFERDNLALYDGIIAVSELDRDTFIREYDFEPVRVLVVNNGVDPDYFYFAERLKTERPVVAFVGTLSYLPNRQAAW